MRARVYYISSPVLYECSCCCRVAYKAGLGIELLYQYHHTQNEKETKFEQVFGYIAVVATYHLGIQKTNDCENEKDKDMNIMPYVRVCQYRVMLFCHNQEGGGKVALVGEGFLICGGARYVCYGLGNFCGKEKGKEK